MLNQPSGEFADLVCNYSVEAFCTSLAFNGLFVIACAYWAFKTRHLPNNFNESRFIVFCVYSQCVLWAIFVPAYFAVVESKYEVVFLCLILIINSTLVLFSLYIPKLYAVYFVTKEDMKLTRGFNFLSTTKGPKRFLDALEAARAAHVSAPKEEQSAAEMIATHKSARSNRIAPVEA